MEKEVWIPYTRVSTDDKGQTRDQQIKAIKRAAQECGAELREELFNTLFDEESGLHDDRAKLRLAIAHAIKTNGTLVVSRHDRLSRNSDFALKLIFEKGIKVRCLNLTEDAMRDKFICSVMFLVAEKESEDKRARNKDKADIIQDAYNRANEMYARGCSIEEIIEAEPLAAPTIKRGKYEPGKWRFGNPNAKETSTQEAAAMRRIKNANTNENSLSAAEALRTYFANNPRNLNAAARYLNENGYLTPRGKANYAASSVKNLCLRFKI